MKPQGPLSGRTLILIMIAVVITGLLIAWSYYGNENSAVDPRIKKARVLYQAYDGLAQAGDYNGIFSLLDSIEQIYVSAAHYRNSFELGVLENNRAAALLTIALYRDSIPDGIIPSSDLSGDSLVSLAEIHVRKAIELYQRWVEIYEDKSTEEISKMTASVFRNGLEDYAPEEVEVYHKQRIKEIEASVSENDRRLSVCFNNLGIIYRYQGEYQEAAKYYEQALMLWDQNLDAENNLNKLINRPLKKRNIVQKLFPPERDKRKQ